MSIVNGLSDIETNTTTSEQRESAGANAEKMTG